MPQAEELVCPCGSDKKRIGEEARRELDYYPGSIHVREYVRPVYACPDACEGQVTVAENRNDSLIEKGLPGPGLLAHVVTNTYADHIPLNRQEVMLSRLGVNHSVRLDGRGGALADGLWRSSAGRGHALGGHSR